MDVTIKKSGLNLTNCIEAGEGFLGSKSYRPKCPDCGYESQNTFSYTGSSMSSKLFCRSCGATYTASINPTDSISFEKKNTIIAAENFVLPVPDGYKASCEGTGANADWCYIVPEDYDLNSDHIEAKPFSFAVAKINSLNGQLLPNPENKDIQYSLLMKYILVQVGAFSNLDDILDIEFSDNCVALFEPAFDESDPTWIKFKGCICAGSEVHLFHVYKNYDEPFEGDPFDELKPLLFVLKQWIKKIKYTGEIKFAD